MKRCDNFKKKQEQMSGVPNVFLVAWCFVGLRRLQQVETCCTFLFRGRILFVIFWMQEKTDYT